MKEIINELDSLPSVFSNETFENLSSKENRNISIQNTLAVLQTALDCLDGVEVKRKKLDGNEKYEIEAQEKKMIITIDDNFDYFDFPILISEIRNKIKETKEEDEIKFLDNFLQKTGAIYLTQGEIYREIETETKDRIRSKEIADKYGVFMFSRGKR